ncbi:thioesterase II family protein [Paenibacillus sp. SYP-B4298]|uniref:thioesterase II family protein n=1 Tax=Paenibacillus sp. SYP-B4298 TaxID=2996034 RepID=UPI0022DD4532|nr:alpha/beta fold hydrolase [Paenibacillus sp. SYP-B4298]
MTNLSDSSRWLSCRQKNERALFRLFCFPYAGGTSSVFRNWHKLLPDTVEVWAVQYPGHGTRIGEELYTDVRALASSAAHAIRPYMDKPVLFYGHSLGAIVAFELALYSKAQFGVGPMQLMVGGRNAPDAEREIAPIYRLPEEEFRAGLRLYGGTPEEVLADTELMDLCSPILRADFQMSETYVYEGGKLTCPIVAWGGKQDEMVPEPQLRNWERFTASRFKSEMLPGGHFFLMTHQQELIAGMTKEIDTITHLASWNRLF